RTRKLSATTATTAMRLTNLEQSKKFKEWGANQGIGEYHIWNKILKEYEGVKNSSVPLADRGAIKYYFSLDLEDMIGFLGSRRIVMKKGEKHVSTLVVSGVS